VSEEITARVPAAPEHVHVLRAVAAGVASRGGSSVDDLADLRLVVDEAATALLRSTPAATALVMTVDPAAAGLTIALTAIAPGVAPPSADGLSWRILRALSEEVEAIASPDGPVIRIRMRPS
jgi:serine/threonine-protein kinase RsbW